MKTIPRDNLPRDAKVKVFSGYFILQMRDKFAYQHVVPQVSRKIDIFAKRFFQILETRLGYKATLESFEKFCSLFLRFVNKGMDAVGEKEIPDNLEVMKTF